MNLKSFARNNTGCDAQSTDRHRITNKRMLLQAAAVTATGASTVAVDLAVAVSVAIAVAAVSSGSTGWHDGGG